MPKTAFTVLGFILFFVGILSIILSIVGTNFTFLSWLEDFGRLQAFLIKVGFMSVGMVMIIISMSNLKEENQSYEDENAKRQINQ